jgi:hypothetical protein
MSEVFAGATFNRQGLVFPRRARTGIHAADILDYIRASGRALQLGRLAIREIGHGSALQRRE